MGAVQSECGDRLKRRLASECPKGSVERSRSSQLLHQGYQGAGDRDVYDGSGLPETSAIEALFSSCFGATGCDQKLKKTPDKAQALRVAMLTTLKRYPKPGDWAAFTLIGEAE